MLAARFSPNLREAGCDEAGRGCLAGPVVAAAVILPDSFTHRQLNDSKKLSAKARQQLRIIIEQEALDWAVAFVDNQEIDKINILKASFLAMHRAVEQLTRKPDLLLIDGNRFTPYPGIAHKCFVKGDGRFLAIAAASILAKTHRDEYMQQLDKKHPGYGWGKNMGYPTQAHRQALKTLGVTPYHRQSFQLLPRQYALF